MPERDIDIGNPGNERVYVSVETNVDVVNSLSKLDEINTSSETLIEELKRMRLASELILGQEVETEE